MSPNPRPWYLDFHLLNGGYDEKVHLFFQDKEQCPFKDCGIVKEIKKDCFNLDMVAYLGVKLVNGDSYLIEPIAFAKDLVKVDQEGETMSKAGWVELTKDTPTETFIIIYIGSFKNSLKFWET